MVQDGFHPTPTSELADLVLPAAIWGEKEGTYTNSERRVSKVNRAVNASRARRAAISTSFSRWRRKLGCDEELFPGWEQPKDAFEEWKKSFGGPALRLLRHELRMHREIRRNPVAVSGG